MAGDAVTGAEVMHMFFGEFSQTRCNFSALHLVNGNSVQTFPILNEVPE